MSMKTMEKQLDSIDSVVTSIDRAQIKLRNKSPDSKNTYLDIIRALAIAVVMLSGAKIAGVI